MSQCRPIESLLPSYVDGEARAETVAQVEAHLSVCTACRERVAAERTARTVLRARAAYLVTPAPPGLRTRLAALARPSLTPVLGWRGRLTAFAAAAAAVVLLVTALEFVHPESNVLFAAQLTIDHLRCFVAELGSIEAASSTEVQRQYAERYGWAVAVPPSNVDAGITLVAARRCPFWLGSHAHLLYRAGENEVSLYVTQGDTRPQEDLAVLGHVERIWTANGHAYVLVARGVPAAELDRIGAYLKQQTQAE